MPNETQKIKYISLDNLSLYDSLLKDYMSVQDAKALKTVTLSENGDSLLFYRTEEPIAEGASPAYSIELPKADLTGYMQKVINALSGDLAIFNENGSVVDSGIKLSDLMTESEIKQYVAQEISKSQHLSKQIVTTLPTAENANDNTIYLIKIDGVEGDAYEEWMLINGSLEKIGDTSTDLTNYYTKSEIDTEISELDGKITDAVTTAAQDATTKATNALNSAKQYTDTEVEKTNTTVSNISTKVTANETNISTLQASVSAQEDRITELENSSVDISVATEAEIRGLFA